MFTEKEPLYKKGKLVFEGKRARFYQWEQKLFDGTTETFEALVRLPSATIFAVVDGKILLEKQEQPQRDQPFYSFPGGMAEGWDEKLLMTAKRELLEEAGLVSDDWEAWELLGSRGYIHWENQFFVARKCRKKAEPSLDPGEKIETSLISFEEVLTLTDNPDFRNRDIIPYFYRMKLYPSEKAAFKNLLGV